MDQIQQTPRERIWKNAGDFSSWYDGFRWQAPSDNAIAHKARVVMRNNFLAELAARRMHPDTNRVLVLVPLDKVFKHGLYNGRNVTGMDEHQTIIVNGNVWFVQATEGIDWCVQHGITFDFINLPNSWVGKIETVFAAEAADDDAADDTTFALRG